MKIQVIQEDIDCGIRNNKKQCPIARAIRRSVANVWLVSVMTSLVYIEPAGVVLGQCYALPREAIEFIQRFDDGNPVVPFGFEI